ncbi:MAG: DUF1638 domain-containing protein [Chloroflexi bacterium]|nr:DUF1638 domain-containing protein [Chloroflexota bacterium]
MSRVKVLGCATIVEALRPRLPAEVTCETLDFGLHVQPSNLRTALQQAIDASEHHDVIVLGYGLCSMAVIGLVSRSSTLVVPRVDDCIGLFLGSRRAYREQARNQPGTYYLTKGWIDVGDTPFAEYERVAAKHGPERARRVMDAYLRHYTRLVLINTGEEDRDQYQAYARRSAARFGLSYEEISGSTALVEKLIHGPWDEEFVVVPPGRAIDYGDFTTEADGK